jgi:hypothetical protein
MDPPMAFRGENTKGEEKKGEKIIKRKKEERKGKIEVINKNKCIRCKKIISEVDERDGFRDRYIDPG